MSRAARWIAWLWLLTCLVYFLHPQRAWSLFSPPLFPEKWPSVILGLSAGIAVLLFPLNRVALLWAALASAVCIVEWHSWLGAYQPLLPPSFLFLFVTVSWKPEERNRLLVLSFWAMMVAGILHCFNLSYLSGVEFTRAGSLGKDFPFFFRPEEVSPELPALCAWLWLGAWALGTVLLLKREGAGWKVLGLTGLATLAVYKVTLYALFVLVPAILLIDGTYMKEWRRPVSSLSLPRPEQVYGAGQLLFFFWYLFQRTNSVVFILSALLCLTAALGSAVSIRPPIFGLGLGKFLPGSRIWLAAWAGLLIVPFLFQMPPPFGETQFTAREQNVVPRKAMSNPFASSDCAELREILALRWGYRVVPAPGGCTLYVFR